LAWSAECKGLGALAVTVYCPDHHVHGESPAQFGLAAAVDLRPGMGRQITGAAYSS
jgi:hypothetical protein